MLDLHAPQHPKDRLEVYRFFNGVAQAGEEGLRERQTRTPLVKSFLLEHVSAQSGRLVKPVPVIFRTLSCEVVTIDEAFFAIRAQVEPAPGETPVSAVVGFVEPYNERFFAYYTAEPVKTAQKRIIRWLTRSSDLDAAWFSSQLLQSLWDRDVVGRGDQRFGKLVFKHDSIFEMPAVAEDAVEEEAATLDDVAEDPSELSADEDTDHIEIERRSARFEMCDRIGRIKVSLRKLQDEYHPLHALYALRFPSRLGHGSHDLYQHGQVTNRSGSFEDHRNFVRYLFGAYGAVLDQTESVAWSSIERTSSRSGLGLRGVPLIVRFDETLSISTFQRWVSLAFQKKNRFRLWGDPDWLGPAKVHVYGADRHLWQPINLEMTASGLTAILPQGTCGNTFHRLVTNIQRYVCPKISAWIGAKPFDELIGAADLTGYPPP